MSSKPFEICVLGLGYIGLPTASIFATKGSRVLGVDVVQSVVETINDGRIHIEEPDLDVLVRAAVQSGNLVAAIKPAPASVYIIAVPTPFSVGANNARVPDLTFVEKASRSIAPFVARDNLVILESTSPVGTTEKVRDWILDEALRTRPTEHADLEKTLLFAHCPERILPGQMLKELVSNDRICGGLTREAAQTAKELYQKFCVGEILTTDARTAEMAKLTENSFRDVNIAFANELSMICDELQINVWELIRLANHHPRVRILQPGPGVGGHCIAVDPWFIVDAAPTSSRLIRTAREVNDRKPRTVLDKILALAAANPVAPIGCFGITFKADVDDIRESPSAEIVEHLARKCPNPLFVVEPHVKATPARLAGLPSIRWSTMDEALAECPILVLLVDHREFRTVDRSLLASKLIVDTRGIWRS